MKPVGKPDAGNPHVRFDERGRETGQLHFAQATAPFLDSTPGAPKAGAQVQAKPTSFAKATVAIGKVHRGERAISRKPPRREGRRVPPEHEVSRTVRNFSGARAPGAAVTRPSLRPLSIRGRESSKARANFVERMESTVLSTSLRAKRGNPVPRLRLWISASLRSSQ
jgi:hypothetical protein